MTDSKENYYRDLRSEINGYRDITGFPAVDTI